MTDVITTTAAGALTMSSREIAELTGKRHGDVMRDIRVMLSSLGQGERNFASTYSDTQGKSQNCFELPKRETLILVSGYDVVLRAKVVDRVEELERQKSSPEAVLSDPASLRRLLLDNVEKVLALESKIEADKPKTSFYDAYINADGLYTLQNAARSMNCRPNLFVRWLKQKYMFYQGTALVPRVQYIQAGIFEVKSEIVDDKARPRSYITARGLEYFATRIPSEIKIGRAA